MRRPSQVANELTAKAILAKTAHATGHNEYELLITYQLTGGLHTIDDLKRSQSVVTSHGKTDERAFENNFGAFSCGYAREARIQGDKSGKIYMFLEGVVEITAELAEEAFKELGYKEV